MPSTIEWTDETWNPVTGCSRVSPGCDNCYMFALYPRLQAMDVPGYEASPDSVQVLPERLRVPLSWRRPRRVFVNSMSDLFHPHVEYDFISKLDFVHSGCVGQRFYEAVNYGGREFWDVELSRGYAENV